jgi:hypothetical protein
VDAEKADLKRDEIKMELAQEYQTHKEPTDEFIIRFVRKHKVCMPSDILFDASAMFDF